MLAGAMSRLRGLTKIRVVGVAPDPDTNYKWSRSGIMANASR